MSQRGPQQLVDALGGAALEDLQTEHVRLFVNAYGGAPCLPYESVYAERQVMGEVAQEVAALYAQWGVEETGEMPDHAAVELGLCGSTGAPAAPGRGAGRSRPRAAGAREFERDHLRAWLPGLAADLKSAAELTFYRALGVALQAVFGVTEASIRARRQAASADDLFLDLPV